MGVALPPLSRGCGGGVSPCKNKARPCEGGLDWVWGGVLEDFTDGEDFEADAFEFDMIQDIARIKDEGGLTHLGIDLLPIQLFVALPFGHD